MCWAKMSHKNLEYNVAFLAVSGDSELILRLKIADPTYEQLGGIGPHILIKETVNFVKEKLV